MDNCKLSDVPSDVGNMPNIRTLYVYSPFVPRFVGRSTDADS
jgi:hypothetical protein